MTNFTDAQLAGAASAAVEFYKAGPQRVYVIMRYRVDREKDGTLLPFQIGDSEAVSFQFDREAARREARRLQARSRTFNYFVRCVRRGVG